MIVRISIYKLLTLTELKKKTSNQVNCFLLSWAWITEKHGKGCLADVIFRAWGEAPSQESDTINYLAPTSCSAILVVFECTSGHRFNNWIIRYIRGQQTAVIYTRYWWQIPDCLETQYKKEERLTCCHVLFEGFNVFSEGNWSGRSAFLFCIPSPSWILLWASVWFYPSTILMCLKHLCGYSYLCFEVLCKYFIQWCGFHKF